MAVKEKGLYNLIHKDKKNDLNPEEILSNIKAERFSAKQIERIIAWVKELEFWEDYGEVYKNLEKAKPYSNLSNVIRGFINPGLNDTWLDVGCGPLRITEIICEKAQEKACLVEVHAIDIVLKPAEEKLAELKKGGKHLPVILEHLSITEPLPYLNNTFNGIGANLVLPYVTDFLGNKGEKALEMVLRDMFRILKPGGELIWSTPKSNVNFNWVFLASLPDMFNLYRYIVDRDFSRLLQGTRILKHAIAIQEKGKNGLYTFLTVEKLEKLLSKIGFVDPKWKKTFSQQVWVNRVQKPL